MRRLSTALGWLLLAIHVDAHAWARQGHQLVGALAEAQLTPAAREEVTALLAGEDDPTLSGIAAWADEMRNADPDRFRATTPWHYVNTPPGSCAFEATRDCPDGACVVGAIEAQRRLLADRTQPATVRRDALKFVVHFVGDVHQPLHASNREDLGGNQFQISLRTDIVPEAYARAHYTNGVMGTNLHSVWDYYLLASAGLDLDAYRARLAAAAPLPSEAVGDAQGWAAESCRLIDTLALYPKRHKMDARYLSRMRPHAEARIRIAAARLAALLNEALK
jgi:hypothetical protein